MFTDYYEVRNWVENFIPQVYGKENLGLSRIEYLLKLLKNPERKFKSIHVAGTSGKGSTAFYTSRLLRHKGFKVGLHVSPHLVYLGERMQINGKSIGERRLVRLFNQIKPFVGEMGGSQVGFPSYFEILVAASFKYFAEEEVDWAVVEVGLGGRLDATNVLTPKVSVITNIGLDHTEILGNTVEEIAFEKAGIIKSKVTRVTKEPDEPKGSKKVKFRKVGIPVVTGATGRVLKVIEKIAVKNESALIKVNTQKPRVGLSTQGISPSAYLAISALSAIKIRVNDAEIQKAFSVSFPGRFEEIENGRPTSPEGLRGVKVILDGAHNTDKIKALIDFVRNSKSETRSSKQKIILVLAFKKGKKWKKMLDQLLKDLLIKRVIATQFNAVTDTGPTPSQRLRGVNKFGFVPAEEIAEYIQGKRFHLIEGGTLNVEVVENSQEAVFSVMQNTKYSIPDTSLVLVTGSLYLVGEVRTMWELPSFA